MWSSVICASRRASWRTCTCRGSTRTKSAASRSSARRRWPRSTTWRWSRSSSSTTRASTRTTAPTASTSRAPATCGARGSRTRSRCASSAGTSPTASARGGLPCRTGRAGCALSGCWRACSSRSRGVRVLRPSDRAPGLVLDDDVVLPHDIEIGANVVIHPGVQFGAGVRIQDAAVVGKPPVLSRTSRAEPSEAGTTEIGDGVVVATQAVVTAGASIGPGSFIGDQSQVRERAQISEDTTIGRGSAVDNEVVIGARVRMQTGCYVTAFSVVEDDVFLGPGVFTYNDNTMGRHERGIALKGAMLRRACRVGGGARILPGIEVGEEAFVATGAVVTRNVAPRTLVMGVPAKRIRDIGDEELIENWR